MAHFPEVVYGERERPWEDGHDWLEGASDPWPGEECGRWNNGRLASRCAKAGSEECAFECPYGEAVQP